MLQDFNSNTFKPLLLKFLTLYIPKAKLDTRAKLPNTGNWKAFFTFLILPVGKMEEPTSSLNLL